MPTYEAAGAGRAPHSWPLWRRQRPAALEGLNLSERGGKNAKKRAVGERSDLRAATQPERDRSGLGPGTELPNYDRRVPVTAIIAWQEGY